MLRKTNYDPSVQRKHGQNRDDVQKVKSIDGQVYKQKEDEDDP